MTASGRAALAALDAADALACHRDALTLPEGVIYTRYVDVWDAVGALAEILDSGEWERPEFHRRAAVT